MVLLNGKWNVENGYKEVVPGTSDIQTVDEFGDCQLHLEWTVPSGTGGSGQGRGNSGVFLMERYEIQVLDSFQNLTYADGMATAIYGQFPPLVDACRPQGNGRTWERLHDDPFAYCVAVHPRKPRRLVLGTNDHPSQDCCFATGIWISEDGGRTGQQANEGLACWRMACVAFNPHDPTQLVCSTLGGGFFLARWR